jgi:hypothetical protein
MNKPKGWYGFQIKCDLHDSWQSNMSPPSKQQYCSRKDRKGNDRPCYDPLSCHWNVCPRLKLQRKAGFVNIDLTHGVPAINGPHD